MMQPKRTRYRKQQKGRNRGHCHFREQGQVSVNMGCERLPEDASPHDRSRQPDAR